MRLPGLPGWLHRTQPRDWAKSSLSVYNGNCVEVAGLDGDVIYVRNSKHPEAGTLAIPAPQWDDFIAGAQHGEFNRGA